MPMVEKPLLTYTITPFFQGSFIRIISKDLVKKDTVSSNPLKLPRRPYLERPYSVDFGSNICVPLSGCETLFCSVLNEKSKISHNQDRTMN